MSEPVVPTKQRRVCCRQCKQPYHGTHLATCAVVGLVVLLDCLPAVGR